MKKIEFVNNSKPFISATTLNDLQNNVETAITESEEKLETAISTSEIELQDEINDLYNNQIVGTATGETIDLNDSAEMRVKELIVDGRSTQDGEPTPDAPVEIKNVGTYNETTGKYGIDVNVTGKNLFDNKAKYAYSNVADSYWTITPLETGIRVKNTFSNGYPYVRYVLKNLKNYVGKTVRAKCNITDSSTNRGKLYIGLSDYDTSNNEVKGSISNLDGVSEISFVVPELNENQQYLYVALYATVITEGASGGDVDYTDLIITIDDEDMTYEPYKSKTTQIILKQPLRSLPSGVKDTHENGKTHRKISKATFDGSDDEDWQYNQEYAYFYIHALFGAIENKETINTLSNYFKSVSFNNRGGDFSRIYNTGSTLYVRNVEQTTLEEFKNWLSENNVEVIYELATPITEEVEVSDVLKTYKNVSHISNSADTNMEVQYYKDIETIINNLTSAALSLGAEL